MLYVKRFLHFWYDFIVGDDWRIAAGVVVVLVIGGLLVADGDLSHALVAALTGLGLMAVAMASIVSAALRARR